MEELLANSTTTLMISEQGDKNTASLLPQIVCPAYKWAVINLVIETEGRSGLMICQNFPHPQQNENSRLTFFRSVSMV